jgi:hypothetical protein
MMGYDALFGFAAASYIGQFEVGIFFTKLLPQD